MAHTIEVAKTGRAGCRACKQKIEKDTLRFGEEVMNAFAEGTAYNWFHLTCAAEKRPVELKSALDAYSGEVPQRAEIDALMKEGLDKAAKTPTEFPHAERASTGRSKCLGCEQLIEKGAIRVAIEREVDTGGFLRKGAGYYHVSCARDQLQEPELVEAIKRNSKGLSAVELEEVEKELESGAPLEGLEHQGDEP